MNELGSDNFGSLYPIEGMEQKERRAVIETVRSKAFELAGWPYGAPNVSSLSICVFFELQGMDNIDLINIRLDEKTKGSGPRQMTIYRGSVAYGLDSLQAEEQEVVMPAFSGFSYGYKRTTSRVEHPSPRTPDAAYELLCGRNISKSNFKTGTLPGYSYDSIGDSLARSEIEDSILGFMTKLAPGDFIGIDHARTMYSSLRH